MVFRPLIFLSATQMFQMLCEIAAYIAYITWKFLKMPLQNQFSQLLLSSFQERTAASLQNSVSKTGFRRDICCNYGIILCVLRNSFKSGNIYMDTLIFPGLYGIGKVERINFFCEISIICAKV